MKDLGKLSYGDLPSKRTRSSYGWRCCVGRLIIIAYYGMRTRLQHKR